jgi:hypothetical protein
MENYHTRITVTREPSTITQPEQIHKVAGRRKNWKEIIQSLKLGSPLRQGQKLILTIEKIPGDIPQNQ